LFFLLCLIDFNASQLGFGLLSQFQLVYMTTKAATAAKAAVAV
jgi:hypothetical protein